VSRRLRTSACLQRIPASLATDEASGPAGPEPSLEGPLLGDNLLGTGYRPASGPAEGLELVGAWSAQDPSLARPSGEETNPRISTPLRAGHLRESPRKSAADRRPCLPRKLQI